jgi:4-diphosphocytidyl-2-C-methyl-D-erythritol kinase
MIHVIARAKINLNVEILGRRDDGFHEIKTVLQVIALSDEVFVRPSANVTLETDDPALDSDDNLVLRAADLLRDETSTSAGAHIVLVKRIPVAAGLGGGSADAAAALVALSRLWDLHLTKARMHEIGASLGSDVPFFLQSKGTALATGRGERIEPSSPAPPGWVIVSVPDVRRPEPKTASMYGKLDPTVFTDGEVTDRWGQVLAGGATSWSSLTGEVGFTNGFEPIAADAYPGWEAALETFRTGARGAPVSMTGTGPGLFAVFDDRHEAGKTLWALNAAGLPSILTEIVDQPLVFI